MVSPLLKDEVIWGILVCRLKLNRSLSKNSTSGPQPYQPSKGGDYHLPYLQHPPPPYAPLLSWCCLPAPPKAAPTPFPERKRQSTNPNPNSNSGVYIVYTYIHTYIHIYIYTYIHTHIHLEPISRFPEPTYRKTRVVRIIVFFISSDESHC